ARSPNDPTTQRPPPTSWVPDPTTHLVSLRLGDYDRSRPLVIDPVLTYSTYLGGTGLDAASGIGVDGLGNAYIAGQTASVDFPVKAGAFQSTYHGATDAFVARINPFASGATSLIYSTYRGGTGVDVANGIAVDAVGNAYVVGQTTSANFPVTVSALRR